MRLSARRGVFGAGCLPLIPRLLDVLSVVLEPAGGERRDEITRELAAFVRDVRGEEAVLDPAGGLAAIAEVAVDEVVLLHRLNDPTLGSEAARARVEGQLGAQGGADASGDDPKAEPRRARGR